MRNQPTIDLMILALFGAHFFLNSSNFVSAQTSDDNQSSVKYFGSSLKTTRNKTKDGNKYSKQVNNTPPTNEDEVIRVDTILVTNEVLVFDESRNPVRGLKREDFIIEEDNEPQEISILVSGDSEQIRRSIVLIVDYSGSQLPYIETSIEAAKVLVDKLNICDRMAIVTDKVELLQDFTHDKILLKNKLDSIKASALSGQVGPSKQYRALMATLNEMFEGSASRPIIIFQTDGDELSQLKGEPAHFRFQEDAAQFSYKDILAATEKTQTTIHTILSGARFYGMSEKEKLIRAKIALVETEKSAARLRNISFTPDKIKVTRKFLRSHAEELSRQQEAVAAIAKFTGGSANYLEHAEQAEKIYLEILSGINMRYVIGYYPINQMRDGKSRKVTTAVRGHPEYTVIGSRTYTVSEE